MRINAGSEEVISCHDIYMTLDDEGNVLGNVVDDECNIYKKHPVTGFKFKGAKIPLLEILKKKYLIIIYSINKGKYAFNSELGNPVHKLVDLANSKILDNIQSYSQIITQLLLNLELDSIDLFGIK